MAFRTSAGSIEIRFTGRNISRLQIADINAAPPSGTGRARLMMDERGKAAHLLIGQSKCRHLCARAPISNYIRDPIPVHIRKHKLRAGQIGAGFSTRRIAPMAECAVALEEMLPHVSKTGRSI